MKKHFLLIALLISSTFIASAQSREDRIEIAEAQRLVLSIELNNPSKTVEDALAQKLKDAGVKTKSSKGFTVAEGTKFLDVSSENLDYYFKVESKDKTKSVLYLAISKGYGNFITGDTDAKIWEGGKAFLNQFVSHIYQYVLEIDIATQDKAVKDSEKAYEKSVKEGQDLTKKLEDNKKDQEAKKADLEKQKTLLGDLHAKKVK